MRTADLPPTERQLLLKIRVLLVGFIIGLVISGVTAFPLTWEVEVLSGWLGASPESQPQDYTGVTAWIVTLREGLRHADKHYPFLAYGTDWLAFAHLVIALVFWGPLKDPVRNRWVIEWGMMCCIAVIPLALIAGPLRGIPWYHQLVDCLFGVFGLPVLWLCRRWTRKLELLLSNARHP